MRLLRLLLLLLVSTPAAAQATRTWVSGVGDDQNGCSRTEPCRTFAAALSKTAKDGEINCLDGGGFGALTISKSITIDCRDTEGGILAPGVNAIVINITDVGDVRKTVHLRGLSINGNATTLRGVVVVAAANVFLDDVTITQTTGAGIDATPSTGTTSVFVTDSTISSTTAGLRGAPTGGAAVVFVVDNSRFLKNTDGIVLGSGTFLNVRNSVLSGNADSGVEVAPAAGTAATAVIDGALFSSNGVGVKVTEGVARLGNCTLTNNGTGVSMTTNQAVKSNGTNTIEGNGTNIAGGTLALNAPQ